jgi:hypothetical protein
MLGVAQQALEVILPYRQAAAEADVGPVSFALKQNDLVNQRHGQAETVGNSGAARWNRCVAGNFVYELHRLNPEKR